MSDNEYLILGNLVKAVNLLEASPEFALLMPEVRVNIVYALPGAVSVREVAAIDGRITVVNGLPRASGMPRWGGSDHMARLVMEIRKYDASVNAGINFKHDKVIEEVVRNFGAEKGIPFGWIDRTHEPAEAAAADGSSMPWKIKKLVESSGHVPRLFYEGDGWGKEPLFVVLGKDAVEVAEIALDIARRYKNISQ